MCDKVHYPPENSGRIFAEYPQLTWWDLGICGDAELVTSADVYKRGEVFTILDSKAIPSRFPTSKFFNILLVRIQSSGLVGTIGTASKQVYRVTTDAKHERHYPMRAQAMWCRNESGPFDYHIEIVRPEGE